MVVLDTWDFKSSMIFLLICTAYILGESQHVWQKIVDRHRVYFPNNTAYKWSERFSFVSFNFENKKNGKQSNKQQNFSFRPFDRAIKYTVIAAGDSKFHFCNWLNLNFEIENYFSFIHNAASYSLFKSA